MLLSKECTRTPHSTRAQRPAPLPTYKHPENQNWVSRPGSGDSKRFHSFSSGLKTEKNPPPPTRRRRGCDAARRIGPESFPRPFPAALPPSPGSSLDATRAPKSWQPEASYGKRLFSRLPRPPRERHRPARQWRLERGAGALGGSRQSGCGEAPEARWSLWLVSPDGRGACGRLRAHEERGSELGGETGREGAASPCCRYLRRGEGPTATAGPGDRANLALAGGGTFPGGGAGASRTRLGGPEFRSSISTSPPLLLCTRFKARQTPDASI